MKHSELVTLAHLSDADSLDTLAREGFLSPEVLEVIPTPWVREVVLWGLNRFFADGRTVAPSREALTDTWAETLEQFEVELPDPNVEIDSIGWAIENLRSNYARVQAQHVGTDFATEIGQSDGPGRIEVFHKYSDVMFRTARSLVSRRNEADGFVGISDSIKRLADRIQNGHQNRGMHLGIDMIDQHTFGVHPGEIAAVCSESGVGKSWMAGLCCIAEWRRGRRVYYVTLENDVGMSYDRLACMATGINYEDFQTGQLTDEQLVAIFTLQDEMEASEHRPILDQLDPTQRTASAIVRKAQLLDADSLIIDQLSFMRAEKGSKQQQRNFQVMEIMQTLKELVDQDLFRIPVLLLAQINRDGAKAARKEGRYRKDHLGDSSWIEQTVSFLWALYRSTQMEIDGTVQFQNLKSRRVRAKHFEGFWQPWMGVVRGIGEVDLSRQGDGVAA